MTANEIFKELLEDPIFSKKYKFSEQQLKKMEMHEPSKPIVELLKLIIQGKENSIPETSIYNQIKKMQKIK